MTPGPWAGGIAYTNKGINTLMSKKKWNKTQEIVKELHRMSKLESYDRNNSNKFKGI